VWHRRDHQSLIELCRSAWGQGLAIPLATAKVGRSASPSVWQLLRYMAHGAIRFCGSGVLLACREAGAIIGARALRRGRRTGTARFRRSTP
jgi:hypothetical protein